MYLPGVDKVEDLQHDKGVKDESIMSGVIFGSQEGGLIICVSVDPIKPTATDRSSNIISLKPLELRVRLIYVKLIERIFVFWNEPLSEEDHADHDEELEDGLSNNVFGHKFGDDVSISCVRLSQQEIFVRVLGGKGKRG